MFLVGYFYDDEDKYNAINNSLSSTYLFFLLLPVSDIDEAKNYLGTNGIFLAILCGFLAPYLIRIFNYKNIKISKDSYIPEEVRRSFYALIPLLLLTITVITLRSFVYLIVNDSIPKIVYNLVQEPVKYLGTNIFSVVIINVGISIFWLAGFNGTYVFNSIMNPIFAILSIENLNASMSGAEIPNIITGTFQSVFINFGGSGSTLAFILSVFLFSKTKNPNRKVVKLALLPGIFNINEPIVYGVPIMMNPVYFVPFILCPALNTILSFIAMYIGIVEKTNGVQIPWTTPIFISGFLVSGYSGIVLQVVLLIINVIIYLPFIKWVELRMTNSDELEQAK